MKLNIFYSKEFYSKYSKYAIMDPGTINLGDIVDCKTFEKCGTLKDFKINYTPTSNGNPKDDDETTYKTGEVIEGTLPADVNGIVKFGLRFESGHSIYLSTKGSMIENIAEDNLGKNNLGKQIIALYKKGVWQQNWIVVTEVQYAKKALIVLSDDKKASIELEPQGLSPKLIDAEFKVGTESSIGFKKKLPESDYTSVLFKAKGIADHWFQEPVFTPKSFIPSEIETTEFVVDNEPEYLKEFVWE